MINNADFLRTQYTDGELLLELERRGRVLLVIKPKEPEAVLDNMTYDEHGPAAP
jgi:hypothetical protein